MRSANYPTIGRREKPARHPSIGLGRFSKRLGQTMDFCMSNHPEQEGHSTMSRIIAGEIGLCGLLVAWRLADGFIPFSLAALPSLAVLMTAVCGDAQRVFPWQHPARVVNGLAFSLAEFAERLDRVASQRRPTDHF